MKVDSGSTLKLLVWLHLFCFLIFMCSAYAKDKQTMNEESMPGDQVILNALKKAVAKKDYELLKLYVLSKDQKLIWDVCGLDDIGPGDAEPFKYSLSDVVNRLSDLSRDTEIFINNDIQITPQAPWDKNNTSKNILIDTDGWVGEYAYLSFFFKISKDDKNREWMGVCYSKGPRLRRSKETGKYQELYYRKPTLPRPGPRVFSDGGALRARIEEIIHFKDFEALKPYAINKKIMLGECSHDLVNEEIKGKEVSTEKIVDFLKLNDKKTTRYEFSSLNYFLESKGWRGKYPYVFFRFTDMSGKGWEWTGVSYCNKPLKSMLMGK